MANPNKDKRPEARSVVTAFRVGAAVAERGEAFAQRLGVRSSALARAAYLDAVEAARVPTAIAAAIDSAQPQAASEDMRALRAAVNRVGGNFNQMLRLWNRAGRIEVVRCEQPCCVAARQKAQQRASGSGGTGAAGGAGEQVGSLEELSQVEYEMFQEVVLELRDLIRKVQAVQIKLRGRW